MYDLYLRITDTHSGRSHMYEMIFSLFTFLSVRSAYRDKAENPLRRNPLWFLKSTFAFRRVFTLDMLFSFYLNNIRAYLTFTDIISNLFRFTSLFDSIIRTNYVFQFNKTYVFSFCYCIFSVSTFRIICQRILCDFGGQMLLRFAE